MKHTTRKPYKHLTRENRIKMETLLNAGCTKAEISRYLNVHRSTITREYQRGTYRRTMTDLTEKESYSCDIGQAVHDYNMTARGKALKISNDRQLADYIEQKIIQEKYSPDAVIHEIRKQNLPFRHMISTRTLYRYIDSGLFLHLTNKDLPHKKRKRKYKRVRVQKQASAGTSIEQRPEHVYDRKSFGDWEMDTVKGRQGITKSCLLVLTERKTRYELIMKMPDARSRSVVSCLDALEDCYGRSFSSIFKTITVDNGMEFSDCKGMEKDRTKLYYCHAYSSYERGTNENQNKLIRRHMPKGTDFDRRTEEEIKYIETWMNHYPRRLLDYRTPAELFHEELEKLGIRLRE